MALDRSSSTSMFAGLQDINLSKNETPVKKEKTESAQKIKAYDFGLSKEKQKKSVRKQFVLTPSEAKLLKETAKFNNMSENEVIERLIETLKH